MKNLRWVFCLVLIVLLLAACGPSQEDLDAQATKIAAEIYGTQTAEAPRNTEAPTQTNTPVPPTETLVIELGQSNITPRVKDFTSELADDPVPADEAVAVAVVDTRSLNVRKGPDTSYGVITGVAEGEKLEIIGKAYTCTWLLIRTTYGVEGWVSSSLVIFDLPCGQIPSAAIPPTPGTSQSLPTPTVKGEAQPTKAPSGKTINLKIINNTGGTISLKLSGPAEYSFSIAKGTQSIKIIKGTYNYTVGGCGTSSSGSKKLNNGDEWEFYCK